MYQQQEINRLIETAIREDVGLGDITSQVLISDDAITSANLVLKQAGMIAGLPFLELFFEKLDPKVKVNRLVEEGSYQKAGAIIAKLSGPVQSILTGERIALNILQYTSGIATITNAYVRKIAGTGCGILDTRKGLPGLRVLEKYGVFIGGGINHRLSLDDRFIIKSNHLYFLMGHTRAPIKESVRKAKTARPDLAIEIEIASIEDLKEALKTEAKVIMLCRMMPSEIKKSVSLIRKTDKRIYVEGPFTLDTVRPYAETGVDAICIGSLTHSVRLPDIVMRLK